MNNQWIKRSLMLSMAVPALAVAQGAMPMLAVDAPKVQNGLRVGSNVVTAQVFNEQQVSRTFVRRGGVGVTLVVSGPRGERTYRAKTVGTRFQAGKPPVKVRVNFAGVEIPAVGAYILTVKVDPDENPIEYAVSSGAGSQSATFQTGQAVGAAVSSANTANAELYEIAAAFTRKGRPGTGLQVRLLSAEGTELDSRRADGTGRVRFTGLPSGHYSLKVTAAALDLGSYPVQVKKTDFAGRFSIPD